jgi:hypothetical protein
MRALSFFAAASLFAAGCGKSPPKDGDGGAERSELEARVAAIEACAKKVQGGGASSAPLKFPDGVKVKFTNRQADVSAPPDGNTLLMQVEYPLGGKPDFEFVYTDEPEFTKGKEALKVDRGIEWGTVRWPSIGRLLQPRYLLLAKADKVTQPDINFQKKLFTTGEVEFTAYGFDLKEGKDLGVVRGRSENSDSVSIYGKKATATNEGEARDQLKEDLKRKAMIDFRAVLNRFSE